MTLMNFFACIVEQIKLSTHVPQKDRSRLYTLLLSFLAAFLHLSEKGTGLVHVA